MKAAIAFVCLFVFPAFPLHAEDKPIPNRLIDYSAFLKAAAEVAHLRAEHRITEDEFVRMAGEAGTIVLDARSETKFALLHVKGPGTSAFQTLRPRNWPKSSPPSRLAC